MKSSNKVTYAQTLKSSETEDWLDYHVIRPFCFLCAKVFARFGVHPNTVTIWSMIIGAASAFFFVHGSFHYEGTAGLIANIIAILLLMAADILDCTDGQLARMTGQKSRMGRILDGIAGYAWFFPIYLALVIRFYLHHEWEFSWLGIEDTPQNAIIATIVVLCLGTFSGAVGLAGQQRLADYYIQAHLFFLKGEKGSELDNSQRQREIYKQMPKDAPLVERLFQKSYITYTLKQDQVTPQFQHMLEVMRQQYGQLDNVPAPVREEFRRQSLPLMTWNGLLTFNFRSFWLFLFCLLDVPVLNFVWEIFAMWLLMKYVNHRHETFCRRITQQIKSS